MKKILVADGLSEPGLEVLKQEAGWQIEVHKKMTPDELKASLADACALIVRSASKVTADVLEHAENLRIIGRAGTGIDNIDLTEATRRGILVTNAPDANTISVADHTIAMLLALCRHLPFAHGDLKQGRWEKKKYEGVELEDKAVGVLGLGRIGREVVKLFQRMSKRRGFQDLDLVVPWKRKVLAELERLHGRFSYAARNSVILSRTLFT